MDLTQRKISDTDGRREDGKNECLSHPFSMLMVSLFHLVSLSWVSEMCTSSNLIQSQSILTMHSQMYLSSTPQNLGSFYEMDYHTCEMSLFLLTKKA